MKTVLVTGGAGMIGSNLVKRLAAEGGCRIRVADSLWRGKREHLIGDDGDYVIDMDRDFLEVDLRDYSSCLRATEGASEVYHLADIVAGIRYVFGNQVDVFSDNALIDTNMLRAARRACVEKLVYVGTACSYPKTLQYGVDAPPLTEDDILPADPESAYGWSKLMGELQVKLCGKETDVKTGVLRLHNVYGAPTDYSPERSQVIPSLIVKAIEYPQQPFIVWGSGAQGRSFIHVDDVVEGLILMMQKGVGNGSVQIGTDYCTSIREIAETIVRISGKDIEIEYDTSKPEGDKGRCADCSKAEAVLNWHPQVKLEQGLERLYRWIEGKLSQQR